MGYIEEVRALVGHKPLILVGAAVVVLDSQGRILLQRRNNELWGLPGGFMEPGESLEDTARREVLEETGISLGKVNLLRIFSGAAFFQTLPNGDQFYSVTAVYLSREIQGELRADGRESQEVRFFPLHELPQQTSLFIREAVSELAALLSQL